MHETLYGEKEQVLIKISMFLTDHVKPTLKFTWKSKGKNVFLKKSNKEAVFP